MTSPAVSATRSADRSTRAFRLSALILAALLVGVASSPAKADSAPVASCSGGPISQTLIAGSPLYVVAQAPVPHRFGATFDGLARTGDTTYFAPTFPTPIVSTATQLRLVLTCSGADGTVASEYSIIVLPPSARGGVGAATGGSASAAAQNRPPVVLKLVLFSIPAILALASLVLWRRRSA